MSPTTATLAPPPDKRTPSRARRALLGLAALSVLVPAMLPVGQGCAAPFDAASKINGLRVLAVEADKPYAQPGDEVTFKMTYYDGLVGPETESGPRPVEITWLGGCFDPIGDQYYACYPVLGALAQQVSAGQLSPDGLIAQGVGLDGFTLTIPEDIVTRRPVPESGPHYGLAYVFFLACAGHIRITAAEGTGAAGDFPLGCFDDAGNKLGAESFVPGYTQIYTFADGRTNANPPLGGIMIDQAEIGDDPPTVERCAVSEDDRRVQGCGAPNASADCREYAVDIVVGSDIAELDPDAETPEGTALRETVWVDYYADRGDFDGGVKLVSDAVSGYNSDHGVKWIPPSEVGPVTIWAVLHDARGGASVQKRVVRVE